MLANLLCSIWVLLATEQWFKHPKGVRYIMKIDTDTFYYLTSKDRRHYELPDLLC